MSLIYNKTTIPTGGSIVYNSTSLQKVNYNGVTVWQKGTPSSANYSVSHPIHQTTLWIIGNQMTCCGGHYWSASRPAFTGDCLEWLGGSACFYFRAKIACKVTISGTLGASGLDSDMSYKYLGYYNGSLYTTYVYYYLPSYGATNSTSINTVLNMNAGDNYAIYLWQSGVWKERTGVSATLSVYGTPI